MNQAILMLGVGGMGMGPLALYLKQSGFHVIGFDDCMKADMRVLLQKSGIPIISPKDANSTSLKTLSYLNNADDQDKKVDGQACCDSFEIQENTVVIHSSAIRNAHPIIQRAQKVGARVIRRGLFLAEFLKGTLDFEKNPKTEEENVLRSKRGGVYKDFKENSCKQLIAVVGSHGKTTVTAMLIHALDRAGIDFGYILGGLFRNKDQSCARFSEAKWVVAEIDESDRTIDYFEPEITLALNADWDHIDSYSSRDDLIEVMKNLFQRTRGEVMVAQSILDALRLRNPDLFEDSLFMRKIRTFRDDGFLEKGNFNALNMTAVENVISILEERLQRRLQSDWKKSFEGVQRRQDQLWSSTRWAIWVDYAHHPVEVEALLKFVKKHYNQDHLIITVIFQPHRYTRTQLYFKEFATVLSLADEVILLPTYSAGEDYLESGCAERILESLESLRLNLQVSRALKVNLYKDKTELFRHLRALKSALSEKSRNTSMEKKDVFLFVGAGNIDSWAKEFVEEVIPFARLQPKFHVESKLSIDEPIAPKTTFRVGGSAHYYAEPACEDDLRELLKCATERDIEVFILGRGSNLIVSDKGFQGLVIRLNHPNWQKIDVIDEEHLKVGAGVRLKELCGKACRLGWSGFEFLEGIPGSLGGALRMNAGAMNGWMFDVVESIRYMTLMGEEKSMRKEDWTVSYRECKELKEAIALEAILKRSQLKDAQDIRNRIHDYSMWRKQAQPREPSAGCIFKNPEGHYAGQLIEFCDLKGKRIGEAEVSTVHGNFIINRGHASSADTIHLIKAIRSCIYEKKGVKLEPEVLLLGEDWSDLLS